MATYQKKRNSMLTFEQKVGLICVALMVIGAIVSIIAMTLIDKRHKKAMKIAYDFNKDPRMAANFVSINDGIIKHGEIPAESSESFKARMKYFADNWEAVCRQCGSTNICTTNLWYMCRECGSHAVNYQEKPEANL